MDINLLSHIVGQRAAQALAGRYKSLTEIHQAPIEELRKDLGTYKAIRLKSALALAQDLSREVLGDSPLLDTPQAVADFLREEYRSQTTEVFKVIALNTRRRLIKSWTVSTGILDTILVHSREVYRFAISANAASIVISHGHPSGDPTPSDSDVRCTRDLIRAGQLLKIELVDHIIMGQKTAERTKDYCSLRELGHFYT